MLAVWAGTSLIAGTAFGAVAWTGSPRRRFAAGAAGLLAGALLVGATASGPLPVVAAALAVAGVANAPTLIAGNALVPEVVPAGEVTEAYTWLNVIVFAGIAAGSTASGLVVDAAGPEAALRTAAVAAAAAPAAPALGRRALVPSPG
jgi:MFS family permease